MPSGRIRPAMAFSLIAALTLTGLPLGAAEQAEVHGLVFLADAATPRSGAVVVLISTERDQEFRSEPTGSDGAFVVRADPGASYTVLVETPEGAFLAGAALPLVPGLNPPLTLALNHGARPYPGLAQQSSGSSLPGWAKWTIVGVLAVAGGFLIMEVTSGDDEAPVTPYVPETPETP